MNVFKYFDDEGRFTRKGVREIGESFPFFDDIGNPKKVKCTSTDMSVLVQSKYEKGIKVGCCQVGTVTVNKHKFYFARAPHSRSLFYCNRKTFLDITAAEYLFNIRNARLLASLLRRKRNENKNF